MVKAKQRVTPSGERGLLLLWRASPKEKKGRIGKKRGKERLTESSTTLEKREERVGRTGNKEYVGTQKVFHGYVLAKLLVILNSSKPKSWKSGQKAGFPEPDTL